MKPILSAVWLAALLAACVSETPELTRRTNFDASAGEVEITVCGDGFVRSAGRRVPLEAIVLELRQRTRAMKKDELARFVVHLLAEPQPAGSDAAARLGKGLERLLLELDIMDVGQVRYL